jgi:hypothetical protein
MSLKPQYIPRGSPSTSGVHGLHELKKRKNILRRRCCKSGSRRAKMTQKIETVIKFHLLKYWMFSFESWRLLLYEGLGISKLEFLIKKRCKKFQLYYFLPFSVIKTLGPDSESDPKSDPYPDPDSFEMQDPDPYPDLDSMKPDPQHCVAQICF